MARSVHDPSEVSAEGEPGGTPPSRSVPAPEGEALLARVRQLEMQLERHRKHAERTSKLFLSVSNYAEWVRESARRDAELALRKANARVERLNEKAIELERAEDELGRVRDELAHLQALTETTRAQLSAFLTAGLEALEGASTVVEDDPPKQAHGDLQHTLRERVTSTSAATAEPQEANRGPAL